MIAAFYFFPDIKPNWSKEKKLKEYLENYQFLKTEYSRVITKGLLNQSMDKFREYFSIRNEFSDVKIIDTLIWRHTALLKSGAFRNRQILYS